MKRILTITLAVLLVSALALPILADAVVDPVEVFAHEMETSIVPWIVIAVILVAVALLVWFLVKRHQKK